MHFVLTVIFFLSLYIAFHVGKIFGRAETLLKKGTSESKKQNTDKIEEAEYEEIN